jgi:hypothetical protein
MLYRYTSFQVRKAALQTKFWKALQHIRRNILYSPRKKAARDWDVPEGRAVRLLVIEELEEGPQPLRVLIVQLG